MSYILEFKYVNICIISFRPCTDRANLRFLQILIVVAILLLTPLGNAISPLKGDEEG